VHLDLEEISRQLAGIGAPGSFAAQSTLPADDLHLEVKGVGRIRLPVSAAAARKLCAAARPARHGFKDQTRLDPKVRDTWEIHKSRISIDQRRWKKALGPALEQIRGKFGLPETCHHAAPPAADLEGPTGRREPETGRTTTSRPGRRTRIACAGLRSGRVVSRGEGGGGLSVTVARGAAWCVS